MTNDGLDWPAPESVVALLREEVLIARQLTANLISSPLNMR
jgi:hypothetical protein